MNYFYPLTESPMDFLCVKNVKRFFLSKLSFFGVFFIFFFSAGMINAQTSLGLGDLAFTGYQSDTPEKFSFVLLKDIESGTVIYFTDHGWYAAGGFRMTEGVLTFTSEGDFDCGDQITILRETFEALDEDGDSAGTVTIDGNFTQSQDGDQIFAYQGTMPDENDESNFIAAIHMNGDWDADADSPHTSAKPDILHDGETALAIEPEIDNAVYECTFNVGPPDEIREEVNEDDNWDTHHSLGLIIPPDCGFVCCLPPTIVCPEDNFDLPDGCNVSAPPAADDFNLEGDQNPDPSLPTVSEGCGDLTLTHHDIDSELDCIHVLKRIYTITDEEGYYSTCTQTFTWMVDDEGPTFDNPPADATVECDAIPDPPDVTASDNCVPPDVLFINEIHYDNAGQDENEFIEIAGMAGIDLSDYELYAYEPHDGKYDDAKTLTGIIPDEGDGWGAVAFDRDYLGSKFFENGISGLALIKEGVRVVEFISYEGVVVATDGPAEGCTSEVIGVEEGSTPDDESLQKIGTGCQSGDFTWIEPDDDFPGAAEATPGFINVDQSFDSDQCPTWPVEIVFEETSEPGDCPQEEIITRTWTATDVCGNETEHVQTITVEDTTPPVPPAPPADVNVQCAADIPAPVNLTADDNCAGDITVGPTPDITPGNCPNQFVMVRTWTFDDGCGNTSSVSQTITVHDNTPPVPPAPPADVSVQCAADVPPPVDLTAVDNCDGNITVGPTPDITPGNCPNQFVMVRTWTFVDGCGNTSSVSQTINVDDTTPPDAPAPPADVNVQCAADVPPPVDLTANDNCDGDITVSPTAQVTQGSCVNQFVMVRTWTFTDVCGNSSSVSQTINVDDTTPPDAPAPPADVNVQCAADIPPPVDLTANDNCDGDITVSPTAQITPGNCDNQFVMVRTWTFTDVCGNSSSVSQTITVHDDTAPTFTAPDDITIECDQDPNDLNITGDISNVMDNCDPNPTSGFEDDVDLSDCGGYTGTITRTWTATDECGNSTSIDQVITIVDTTPPTFTVPEDITIDCSQDPNDLTLTGDVTDAMDNCDTGGANPPEIWVNEFHYDNASGDVGEFIEVAGTAGLDLSNYSLVLYNGNGGGTYNTVALAGIIPDESNGFGAVSFAISGIQNGAPDGIAIVEGGNNVIQFLSYEGDFVATNGPANGMNSTDIGVQETGTTPIGESLQLSGTGSAYADFVWNAPSPESPGSLNANQTMVPPPPPVGLPVEHFDSFTPICNGLLNNITRTWRVTDACGNVNEQVQMITVEDNNAPTFTVPADVTIECSDSPNDLTITGNVSNVMDNCDPDPMVSYEDEEDLTDCGGYTGTITRTWTVTDACGNPTSQTQIITVEDTTPPTFTVPADVTIACADDPEDLTITGDVEDAMDNCTGVGQMSVWINEFHYDNSGGDVGEFIEVAGNAGINLSNYQLVLYNGSNGTVYNTINLSGIFTNQSNGFGFISFAISGIQNGAPDGIALVQNGTNVLEFLSYEGTFDAVGGPADGLMSTDVGVSETGSTPVGFSLQLVGSGSESADFSWSGPANDSPGSINAGQSMIAVPPPTTMLTIEFDDEVDVTTCDGGTILRTWTVTDACDNATSGVQTITVSPPLPPEITCPADMTVECIEDVDIDPENADVVIDCDLTFKVWVSQPDVEGAENCPGTTYTYTYKVLDDCGGLASCQQVITIENDPPDVTVIPGETVECFEDIITSLSDATVTTACGDDDYDLKILPPTVEGTFDCPGTTYTYTYRVTDQCGRISTADRVFTVGNNAPPTIVAPPDMTVTCSWNINVNPDYAEVTTGCSLGFETTLSGPVISGTDDCPGTTYTYTYTVTDDCGRQASDIRVFTIQNEAPVMECPDNCLIQNCEDGNYLAIIDAWIASVTATSSCGDDLVVNNNYNPNNLGFCISNGYTPVTFTATDNCGRTTVCVAMIVIIDTEDPIIIEPAQDMLTVCNANTQAVLDQWVDNNGGAIVEDGCWGDDISWSTSPSNPTINCMGMMGSTSLDVTFTATDGCGNSVSTTATFTALMGTNDVIIHGGLQTEEGSGVEEAKVTLEGNSPGLPSTQMSTADGEYEFGNLTLQSNYVVTPEKNDDPINGLSTFDIVLMTKHILATQLLDSPYKIIAADINNNGSVTAIDVLKLRRMILFIDTEFTNNTSWRFVDAEFIFPDPTNPFASSFPEVYSINGLLESEEADFVAIKVGDLNGSASPNNFISGEDRNIIGDLTFEIEDQLLEEGKQYDISFRSSDFNEMLGYQFTLNFNAAVMDFNDIEAGSLVKFDAGNVGLTMLDEGVITASWANNVPTSVENDEVLFSLSFTAKADSKLSQALRISSQYTKSEAYNNEGMLNIGLNFRTDGKVQSAPFALYQNQPNPFKDETVIGFNLPETGTAKMKFYDVTGKLLKEVEGEYNQGYNEISIRRADLPSAGVLYYQLETETNAATKKMILMTLK